MNPKELEPENPEAVHYDGILREYLERLNDPFLL